MLHLLPLQSSQSITNLPHHDGLGEAGLTISEALADAEERMQSVAKRRLYFFIRPLILLAEVLTALGMTDDHELTTELLDVTRDCAREGALVFPTHILRAELIGRRIAQCFSRSLQCGKRRSETDVQARIGCTLSSELADKDPCFRGRLVHFPVTDDEGSTHEGLVGVASPRERLRRLDPEGRSSRGVFAFEQFQRGAAAGRDERHIFRFAGSMHGQSRFTSADDRQCIGIGNRVGHREGASGIRIDFKDPHRSVPQNRLWRSELLR